MKKRFRRRGFSLLVVMGLLLVITVAAVTTLAMVGQEAALQGQARREVEAFFAAEAGLSEGRERLRLLAEGTPNFNTYTTVMAALPPVAGIGANGEVWFEVLPATPYRLTTDGVAMAIDPSVTTSGQELNAVTGARFDDYPTGANVRYRVFLRDDADETPAVSTADANAQVWLVSIGEVDVGGGMPIRRVTQALVTYSAGVASVDCLGQKGGCADKTNGTSLDARTPSITGGTRNL